MLPRFALGLLLLVVFAGCGGRPAPADVLAPPTAVAAGNEAVTGGGNMFQITSSAIAEGQMIPRKYTCDGENVSPPLAWSGVPPKASTLALIADDPDAPLGTWTHWIVFNLPASTSELPESIPVTDKLENGALQGTSSFRKVGYGGPCPPGGTHRYYFTLYALDAPLSLGNNATAKDVQSSMQGHTLASAQLMGRYKR
jgi:Raf kinase inhibitor-like YbhB/YbcL family protein